MSLEGKQILLVDNPEELASTLSLLRDLGVRVSAVSNPAAAMALARREEFDMALIGVGLEDRGSDAILARLADGARVPSVLMLARPEDAPRAIRALSRGANDYLLKPLDRAEVRARVERLLRWRDHDDWASHQQEEMSRRYLVENLVSRSSGMQRVREQILQVAAARSTVLIQGESGVGKELVAKAIHYNSPRRAAPFIAINCSAIPVSLIESELFGHEKGAFTGAVARQRGKFELAHGGTMFLDEIGEMDLQTQSKLLRVLEEREFMRVGGSRSVRVDVRVLAATNQDLKDLIARGRFREDLYFRLNVITIRVPPLRRRTADIPELARALLERICRENGLPSRRLSEGALRAFERYSWPGNVRELKNVLESTAITRPGSRVEASDLPDTLRGGAAAEEGEGAPLAPITSLREMERDLISRVLMRHGGNRTRAARALGIGVRTLQRKMKAFDIVLEGPRGRPPRSLQRSTITPSPGSSSASMKPSRIRTPPSATSS
jgi:DNA-binding NtrC family response regulator